MEESVSTHHVKVGNMKSGKVIFNAKKVEQRLLTAMINEQTDRLIEYAKKTIWEIGHKINSYHSRNHMDRSGNLLDSLCWGVSYNGEMKASGFFREQKATTLSYLHEFSDKDHWFPVGGHTLAENFIKQMGNLSSKGWRVFFAILAPYWGYWEKGFTMKRKGESAGFYKFAVMTEMYDKIGKDLKPATVNIKVNIPTTTDKSVMDKRIRMRDYRMDRNLGSPYDMYNGKYSFDRANLSRRNRK